AAAVLFVVLQFWWVWPHFKEWSQVQTEMEKAKRTLKNYQAEVARTNEYQIKLARLEKQGSSVLPEQPQANILIGHIQSQAAQFKVNPGSLRPVPRASAAKTNEFFEEQTIDFSVNPTGDKELVDFLVAMGNSDLMVRVKELSLQPDPGHYKLQGTMKLVASFQKKAPTSPALIKPGAAKPGALSSTKP